MSRESTQRFSSRVENYVRYRPGYPAAVVDLLRRECGLTAASMIADIGCGTGLLALPFLANGNAVLGVEPNREMREAGARLLAGYPKFTAVNGTAEATTLPDRSVDFVVAGQAFHWFNRAAARPEFARILRPGGWVALVWNERREHGTPFLEGYDALLRRFAPEYETSNHRNVDAAAISAFFAPAAVTLATFDTAQSFDYAGLEGRLLSSSYSPEAGHPLHLTMLAELRALFDATADKGDVTLSYDTKVWYGRLAQP